MTYDVVYRIHGIFYEDVHTIARLGRWEASGMTQSGC